MVSSPSPQIVQTLMGTGGDLWDVEYLDDTEIKYTVCKVQSPGIMSSHESGKQHQ